MYTQYRKIPIISPGFIFVQKAVLLGLFSGELIFRGAYNWFKFCISKVTKFGSVCFKKVIYINV